MRSARFILLAAVFGAVLAFPALCGETRLQNLLGADFEPGGLKLPLVVTERSGVDRKGTVVSSGVPFPPGFLPDVRKLRVTDSAGKPVPSQASLMIKWHKPAYDDSAQWVLVSFPADVAAGKTSTYYLLDDGKDDGKDAAPATALRLSETKGAITVETGPAKFAIPKSGRALISEAFFGADKVIGGEGLRAVVKTGEWAERGLAKGSEHVGDFAEAVVEESGPVRVVIRLQGTFRPGDKEGKLYGFTARLYFAAGSPAVRVVFTISNGRLDPKLVGGKRHVYVWPIEDASLLVDLALGEDATIRTRADNKNIDVKGEARALQSDLGSCRVSGGGNPVAGKAHSGTMAVTGGKAGLACAVRNFRFEHPSALAASVKRLRAGLLPAEAGGPFNLNIGQRKSWDLRLTLSGGRAPDLKALRAEQETLLLFRPLPAWMVRAAASGAWPTGLALVKDPLAGRRPTRWAKEKLKKTGWYQYGSQGVQRWNAGGLHWNQDSCFAPWVLWGDGAGFDEAESKTLAPGDMCPIHYDQIDMKTFWFFYRRWKANDRFLAQTGSVAHRYPGWKSFDVWNLPDSGHMGMLMYPEYYMLTGDMRAREAWEHIGARGRAFLWHCSHEDAKVKRVYTNGDGTVRKRDPDAEPGFMLATRYVAWPLYELSQYYRLTGDPAMLAEARIAALGFRNTARYSPIGLPVSAVSDAGTRFNVEYGAYGRKHFGTKPAPSASQWQSNFYNGLVDTALTETYLMTRDEEVLDAIIGYSDCMCHHAMLRNPQGKRTGWTYCFGDYWGPYGIWDDTGKKSEFRGSFIFCNFTITQPLGWTAVLTGRSDYLEVLRDAMNDSYLRGNYLRILAAHLAVNHPKVDSLPPAAVKDLKAEALGGGKARLTWTAPGGDGDKGRAARYQVKWSGAQIVERVKGWPDKTPPLPATKAEWEARAKTFNAKQRAFWAAYNAKREPMPGPAGAKQEMTVGKLPAGKVRFAIKSWDGSENVSQLSNVAEVNVR